MKTERLSRTAINRRPLATASVAVSGLLMAIVALALIGRPPDITTGSRPVGGSSEGADSCDRDWPATRVTCDEVRRSISTGMSPLTSVRIWLTTLAAVDAHFQPKRQVADHPADPSTPVWLFVYAGEQEPILIPGGSGQLVEAPREGKLVHVAVANDPASAGGAFIYVYGWADLGSPSMPLVLPQPAVSP